METPEEAVQNIIREMREKRARTPHIRRPIPHSGCYRPTGSDWPMENDVRRCVHGKIQIACGREIGLVGAARWRDVSRFWSPKLYQECEEALKEKGL